MSVSSSNQTLSCSEIVSADFDAGGCNVMETTIVKGKKKKGALQLYPTTVLCSVETRGGKKYKVRHARASSVAPIPETHASNRPRGTRQLSVPR